MTDFLKASRVADEKIYIGEAQSKDPKKIFVSMADYIQASNPPENFRLLDVGCAAGELFAYLKTRFDKMDLYGMDVSQKLVDAAAARFSDVTVVEGSVSSDKGLPFSDMDFVTISGVLNCLDDPSQSISNLIGALKPGGKLIIWDLFNPFPIDVIVRHRRVGETLGGWETGWNTFSQAYVSQILKGDKRVKDFRFERFSLDKKLPPREDPMRTWTVSHEENPYQMVNGMGQLVNQYFLYVQV